MAYVLCLIYVAMIYIRPGELVAAWSGYSLVDIVAGAAIVATAISFILRPRRVAILPNDWCFLGYCVALVVSNPANGWLEGGYLVFWALQPLVALWVLVRLTVETGRQLRGLVVVVILLTVFHSVSGIVQYSSGTGLGNSTAAVEGDPEQADSSDTPQVRRIRGTGIFNDSNDLAMSLLIVFPFLFTAVLSPDSGLVRRLMGLATVGIVAYALFLTQSRGGIVGLGTLGAAYSYRRFGRMSAAVVLIAAIALVLVAGSRVSRMESSDESAQGRVQAWSAGLEMFKSRPVLGVGAGQFTEYHERAAHNSFVHIFAELGFVGGFFFVGLFYWVLVGNGASRNVAGAASSPLALDIWASVIGVIVTSCFLSRQYSAALYIPIAIGAARMTVEQNTDQKTPVHRAWDWPSLLLLACAVVVATYVAVRLLAVWSG